MPSTARATDPIQASEPDRAGSLVVEDGELVLIPMRPPNVGSDVPAVRVVGPGRRERGYLDRIRELQGDLELASRALSVAECIEHGAERRGARLEREVKAARESELELRQAQHRLILALGALQRENEVLQQKLAAGARATLRERITADRPGRSAWTRALSAVRAAPKLIARAFGRW